MKPFGYPVHVSGDEPSGKPDAGNLHVRFDEGEGSSLPTLPMKRSVLVKRVVNENGCKIGRNDAWG